MKEPKTITAFDMEKGSEALQPPLFRGKVGDFVAVRVAREEETHLGVMLGDLARGVSANIDDEGVCTVAFASHNPAMYVPELKRVVLGCESWWGLIDSPEGLKKITDQDVDSVWYVRALKALEEIEDAKDTGGVEQAELHPQAEEEPRDQEAEGSEGAEPEPLKAEGSSDNDKGSVE